MSITCKIISAKSGVDTEGNKWANFSVILPANNIIDFPSKIAATVWNITPEQATTLQSKIDEAKQSGQQVTVDIIDPKIKVETKSYKYPNGDPYQVATFKFIGGRAINDVIGVHTISE